ncbi:MAG TPA: helix-turn-helix domain-containing protein [Solirubrobacteraceae bacterium]|jgi:DNA-binding HxlR family transcriptional regulator
MPRVEESEERFGAADLPPLCCCPQLHEAVELVGRRWTGAILEVLRQAPRPLRFSEIAQAVPDLSDRLCSERMKELEHRGLVERRVDAGPPVRVTYALTPMGEALGPALSELKTWAQQWLAGPGVQVNRTGPRPAID